MEPPPQHPQRPELVFIGQSGAGKSAGAREAAEMLGCALTDTDELTRCGESVREIFAREGEAGWRAREADAVAAAMACEGVVALGAGVIESESIREELADRSANVVWCRAPIELAWERAKGTDRPLAQDFTEFKLRWEKREPLYESVAGVCFTHSIPARSQLEWFLQTR